MRWFRRAALSIVILTVMLLALAGQHYYKRLHHRSSHRRAVVPAESELLRIEEKAGVQRAYLSRHGFNASVCFLVDMRLPSGKNRFFVYDLRGDSVLTAGLVAHGCGNRNFSDEPVFSNVDGSGCTSLGRYRVGYKYWGQFGEAYKLYGLDTSNSRAFARNVVLHAYMGVPERETYPNPICNSLGCPMVSNGFFKTLQPVIEKSGKPICLWVFD
jgi:hypothetical protein